MSKRYYDKKPTESEGIDRTGWEDKIGLVRAPKQEPRYDVYEVTERRMIASNKSQREAAAIAGVTEGFVVAAAKRPAKNRYGRVATETGYFFYIHGKVPTFEASRTPLWPEPKLKREPQLQGDLTALRDRYVVADPEGIKRTIRERGYGTLAEFERDNGLNPSSMSNLLTGQNWKCFPDGNPALKALSEVFGIPLEHLVAKIKVR